MPKETIHTSKFPGDVSIQIPVGRGVHGPFVSIGVIDGEHEGQGDPRYGLYAELNRDQINTLIRVLRKAREKMFGRDE